ncbi:MAG: divergent polysaccharide deacetylase family protein [candidate division KSB1 bacterium]|jgi:polysaccharide deacetylase 2 family uncharacterized protein YibQ|nr:divergent polysaccharide deacetylase family protein [candidate division KSB1 bacterium]
MARKPIRKKTSRRKISRRSKNASSQNFSKLVKLLLLLGACGFVLWYFLLRSSGENTLDSIQVQPAKTRTYLGAQESHTTSSGKLTRKGEFNERLNKIFNKWDLLPGWITRNEMTVTVRLPRQINSIDIIQDIIVAAEDEKCSIRSSREDFNANRSELEIEYDRELLHKFVFIQEPRLSLTEGKFAIIIDDIGYGGGEHVNRLLSSPYNFTIAILPGAPGSQKYYQEAKKYKKETLIHMPMEAIKEKVDYTDYTIFANMRDADIRERINRAIKAFPGSSGMNNHMGSRVTADREIMSIILDELKKNDRFFIDSRTTDKSVAYQMAKDMGVSALENNLFIEKSRNDDAAYLRDKLEVLKKVSKSKGYAVAIGHPYVNTVDILLREIPKLQDQGYILVPVSELLK